MEEFGIYGIWFEKELVYIGKTKRNFKRRFQEHLSGIKYNGDYLYREIRKFKKENSNKTITFKPILKFNKNVSNISDRDLSCMEYALISYLKPKLNRDGIIKAYKL